MLENTDFELLQYQLNRIGEPDVLRAYAYLLGVGAASRSFVCRPGGKRDVSGKSNFRFERDGRWELSFIVNRTSLLFYFRSHWLRRNGYPDLSTRLAGAENGDKEWKFRITSLDDAIRVSEVAGLGVYRD